jgi:phage/plasmid-like protein (TIGR03299 family)
MAHEIDISLDGTRQAFASARVAAWHGLGTVVDHAMSAAEALQLAHLADWNVRKAPITATVPFGAGTLALPIPDRFAIIRDSPFERGQIDTLGVVGSKYVPFQNEENTDIIDAIRGEAHGTFETAGALRGGRDVFVTTLLPETMLVGGVDPVRTYLAALNSHDGSSALRFLLTNVRVVCSNTQEAAIRGASTIFSRRHTRAGTDGIAIQARALLDLTFKYNVAFEAEAEKMIQATMSEAGFWDIVAELYPVDEQSPNITQARAEGHRQALMRAWSESETLDGIHDTRWAAYQTVTEYLDHAIPVLGKSGEDAVAARHLAAIGLRRGGVKAHAFDLLTA